MTNQTKIDRVWQSFTGRYGAFQLKDGQDTAYVKKSWEIAFQAVSEERLVEAARRFMSYSKYERWPSTGDLQEILDEMRKTNPRGRDEYANMSPEWKRDWAAFSDWWHTVPLFIGRDGEAMVKRDEVFADFMSGHRGSFAMLAVKAWRRDIFQHWDMAVVTHLNRVRRMFEKAA